MMYFVADQRGSRSADAISVSPTPWLLLLGIVPSVLFLLVFLFAPVQDPNDRVPGSVGVLLLFNVPMA